MAIYYFGNGGFFAFCYGKDLLFILNQVRTLFVHGHLLSLFHSLALWPWCSFLYFAGIYVGFAAIISLSGLLSTRLAEAGWMSTREVHGKKPVCVLNGVLGPPAGGLLGGTRTDLS